MKYGEILEFEGENIYWQDEDAIIDEAFARLNTKLQKKFEAYEEGYGTYFKDFEQWFLRYAPDIWNDVIEEAFEEKHYAEMDANEQNERMNREMEKEDYDEMIRKEYYKDKI